LAWYARTRDDSEGAAALCDRFIFPVQIIGDQDGKWNKTAYKSDAYYGNPLTGFSPAP
jgi:hypothetical protein